MKNLLRVFFALVLSLSVVACGNQDETYSLKVLCPTGAPGLALLSEYETINENGKIDFVDGTDLLVAEFTKAQSEYDVVVAPVNLGCKLIEKGQTEYKLAGVITWGNLYLVGTSQDALNSGEIALFGEGAVPQKVFESIDAYQHLTKTYYQSATIVQQQLLAKKVQVGMLAEPAATATIAKAKQQGLELSILSNLQEQFGEGGYSQAAIFVKDLKAAQPLLDKIDAFTNNGYENLEELLNSIGTDTIGLPSSEIVLKTIERQNVHYKKASECVDDLTTFLKLFNITFSDDMIA